MKPGSYVVAFLFCFCCCCCFVCCCCCFLGEVGTLSLAFAGNSDHLTQVQHTAQQLPV